MLSFLSIRAKLRFVYVSRHFLSIKRSQSTMFCLQDYDCVGFDLDHTLCSYHLGPLSHLIYSSLASFLVENRGYPSALLDSCLGNNFAQKGLVLDKKRGNFLKLDAEHRITRVCHGTKPMIQKEVELIYGPACVWEQGIPAQLAKDGVGRPFYVFKDAFVIPGAAVCARIVDILDEQNGRPLDSYNFWQDYLEGLHHIYDSVNFQNGQGGFFPELRAKPDLYLRKSSERAMEWLRAVAKEKTTFLVTNANYETADFIAQYCLGKEWKENFDFIVTFARKPGFFFKEQPFKHAKDGQEVMSSVIEPHSVKKVEYSQGNFIGLQKACAQLCSVEKPQMLYFGDSLVEDIYSASEGGGCDTLSIVVELNDEADSKGPWGSFFTAGKGLSLWANLLAKHSRVAVPDLETLSVLGISDKIPSFTPSSPLSGYFPVLPKAFNT